MDLNKIPLYQPRKFIHTEIDFSKPDQICTLYKNLIDTKINSWKDLETFLEHWSELESIISEHSSVLRIRMTCQTDDKTKSEAYSRFTQELLPILKPLDFELKKKLVTSYDKIKLHNDRYDVLIRNARADIELFRKENIELQKREDAITQDYQTICGAMMVEFEGKELTMPQIRKKLSEPDRALREKAWRAMVARSKKDAEKLDDIFDEMVSLRHKMAINAGLDDYREYRFKEWYRFDYTPKDCFDYHDAVTKAVAPALAKIFKHRREVMKLDSIRPWDFEADPYGRAALSPFKEASELIGGVRRMVGKLHPDFDKQIGNMEKLGLLDLVSRKGKAPGGYQSSLDERRQQFIFGNVVGSNDNIRLLLHEGGHAFHSAACREEPLVTYRHAPLEFCEVASQAMELLGGKYLAEFYSLADAGRAWREQLEDIVYILAWIANVDAFQHWIYENPENKRAERHKRWVEINERFFANCFDWRGLEEYRLTAWQRQLHIFQYPFYYIEYAIAELGALGIWQQSLKNPQQAINNYRKALALGGSKPLPQLFAAAGLYFDFSIKTVAPLIEAVMNEWSKVKDA